MGDPPRARQGNGDALIDENALRRQAAMGAKYKEHLDDFHAAIDAVRDQYIAEWPKAQTVDERERLWVAVRVCDKMKEHFGSLVGDGTLASHKLTELKRLR